MLNFIGFIYLALTFAGFIAQHDTKRPTLRRLRLAVRLFTGAVLAEVCTLLAHLFSADWWPLVMNVVTLICAYRFFLIPAVNALDAKGNAVVLEAEKILKEWKA
jgi:membrane-associated PAP2 superfamily phosphatase